ncbi:unnamed protein product [Rotaria magnacalcarata]|uniref:Uncharacterized protein n=1 Tax=Rotaria magnacalcarata TaxID=392030 RepID=A0A819I9B2_9BILA|nr:unnamed protein product [Rotaria magnacalcarata]CAF3911017.1 unnamed protein product [Rotaria magnacalcarata]
MFKLESYITPWLLSYIDQYVKLRREDFQLSLWGGDVVFYNLELRLANIQKLVPTLPIIFQSAESRFDEKTISLLYLIVLSDF